MPDTISTGLEFLVIGQIVKAHGVRGEVSIKVLTDFPERFEAMETVYLGDNTSAEPFQIQSIRWHRANILMKFVNIPDRTAAEQLRGLYLKIPIIEAMPLEPEAFYHYQILGLDVVTDEGEALGQVSEILETGANDVYAIVQEGRQLLLPATQEVILDIDLDKGLITVHLLEGLI